MSATAEHLRSCPLCEAMCGLRIEVDGDRVVSIRGDDDDPFSRGYICPKGASLADVHHDPERITEPLRRRGDGWEPVSWEEALDEAAERLVGIQRRDGDDAVAVYVGNPVAIHSYGGTLLSLEFAKALCTRNLYSTASIDHLPHMFASYHMLGSRALLPIPDVDRTDFMLMLGANPVVSNGSVMTAPGMRRRLQELRERGGRFVVVDPRRTRTAELADTHLAIVPGTDVLLLLALVRTIFDEGLTDLAHLADHVDGLDELRAAAEPFTPERVAPLTGIDAEAILQLARDFAGAPKAVCYGRLGVCQQEYGALCCWLLVALNAITGNLDRVGGWMFTTPAVDLVALAAAIGETGSWDRYRSRVSGMREFGGELPLATLAEEIDTPGAGQVRALVTVSGNPVLSFPNGRRLDRALGGLDFMVSVDYYLNETTRHADLILPPTSPLERDHYDLLLNSLAVRNVTRYNGPLFERPGGRDDWEVMIDLARGVARRRGGVMGTARALELDLIRRITPRRILAAGLRFGPHGQKLRPRGRGVTLGKLERHRRTVDLGPLRPYALPGRLMNDDKRVKLAPAPMLDDLPRARRLLDQDGSRNGSLRLIGRRQLRDNNSWMHNLPRLMSGPDRCTLLVHPEDAEDLGVDDGRLVRVRSRVGEVVAPAELTTEVRPGVVSLPHGYGHGRDGTRLSVAADRAGVSANDVTDDGFYDMLSGTSSVNGVAVTVEPHEIEGGTNA